MRPTDIKCFSKWAKSEVQWRKKKSKPFDLDYRYNSSYNLNLNTGVNSKLSKLSLYPWV